MSDIPLEQDPQNAPPPTETPAPPDADLEAQAVEIPASAVQPKPMKVLPISVVHEERKATKAAKDAAKEWETKFQELQQQFQQVQPWIQALQQRKDIQEELRTGKRPGQQTPQEDGVAKKWAETLGLYDAYGNLDLARGRAAADLAGETANQRVAEAVQPVKQATAAQQASMIRQAMYGAKDRAGRPAASREAIDNILSTVPAEILVSPGVAERVLEMAAGADRLAGKEPQEPPSEPLYSESPGGRPVRVREISAIERRAMQQRGIKDEKTWRELSNTDDLSLE